MQILQILSKVSIFLYSFLVVLNCSLWHIHSTTYIRTAHFIATTVHCGGEWLLLNKYGLCFVSIQYPLMCLTCFHSFPQVIEVSWNSAEKGKLPKFFHSFQWAQCPFDYSAVLALHNTHDRHMCQKMEEFH